MDGCLRSCHYTGQRYPTRCWIMASCLYHCLITGLFIFSIHGLLSIENGLFWTLGSPFTITVECNTVCIFNLICYHIMVKWFLRGLDPTQNTSSSRRRNCVVFISALSGLDIEWMRSTFLLVSDNLVCPRVATDLVEGDDKVEFH